MKITRLVFTMLAAVCCMMFTTNITASAELIRIAGGLYDTDSHKDEDKFLEGDSGCLREGFWELYPEPNLEVPAFDVQLMEKYPFTVKAVMDNDWYAIFYGPVETNTAFIHAAPEDVKDFFYVLYREEVPGDTPQVEETTEPSTFTEAVVNTTTTTASVQTTTVMTTTELETVSTTTTSSRYIRIAGCLYDTEAFKDETHFRVDDEGCVKAGEWEIYPEPSFAVTAYEVKVQEKYPFIVKEVMGNGWYRILYGPAEEETVYIHVSEEDLKNSFYVFFRENNQEETSSVTTMTTTQTSTTTTTTALETSTTATESNTSKNVGFTSGGLIRRILAFFIKAIFLNNSFFLSWLL